MGADLTFQCLGPNQYRVTLTVYRDCHGIPLSGPLVINVSSAQCGVNTTLSLSQVGPPVDITPVCFATNSYCHGGPGVGVEKYIFQGILNLPPGCGSDWVLSWELCCRNAAITTLTSPGNEDLYIESHLNNTLASCDNSPTFSNDPVGVYCNGYPQFFNHGATDVDGDSLYFYLAPSLHSAGSQVAYASPYSGTNPIGTTTGTHINGANGQLTFTPNQTQIAVMKVKVDEFRNGVLIGTIERDMQLIIQNCTNQPPTAGGVNGATGANANVYNTTACSNFCFTIQTADADVGDSVFYNFLHASMPGATITSNGAKKPLLTICWAPTQADVGSHTFVLALKDNACPYYGTASIAYTVIVAAANNPPVNAGPDVSLCPGASTTLTATSTGTVTSYTWSDGTTTHSGASWTVSPSATTIYTVSAVYANGCQATDQVVVKMDVAPTVTAFPTTSTICSTSDTIQLSAFGTNVAHYLWTPAAGLTCTTCANPKASPTATTVYSVSGVDSAGCPGPPVTVTVNLAPPPPVQSCAVIYATTTGTGNGSQASPTSLAGALIMAQCNNSLIKLGIGTYTIDNPITNVSSYTTIEGGFDPANNWIKTSTPGATTIHRSALNMESSTAYDKRIVAIYLNGKNYFRFQDVTIETADCPALAPTDNSGYSNYVLHMTNCANYNLVRCQIKPGKPTDGRAGTTTAGSGSGPAGGAGGAAGTGAGTGCSQTGSAGGAGTSVPGAAGGASGGGATGSGCNTVGCGVNASSGSAGGNGGNGAAGVNAPAVAPATPGTTTTFFQVAGQSASGTNGGAGAGGGGGGGGQKGTNCTCSINGSDNGGAGGNGGNAGLAGTGGYGGGGSFGIYYASNGTGGAITDCDIVPNVAGVGGVGGTGQAAGARTLGANGSSTNGSCSPQASGGKGGDGGTGGAGGNGQPGAAGVTAEIVSNGTAPTYTAHGTATAITTGINNPAIFNLPAQAVISCANISCTNTNDTLSSAASGNWTTGAGASVASGTGTSLVTQYTTVGRKNIGFNADVYTGFVNIAINQASFIPTIQSSAPVLHLDTFWLCQGSAANFSAQFTSADSLDWNFGGAVTPNTYYGGLNYQNLPGLIFNTVGTFRITFRFKTSCCGWSPYDTVYMVVDPKSTINFTGPTVFCAGDSVHILIGGTGTTYTWLPTAGVSNPTGTNVYVTPPVTTTYLVTAYSPHGLCNADTAITITKNSAPVLTMSSTPSTCSSIGSASVAVTPAGTYTYAWNVAGSGTTVTPEPAGTYSVTVTPVGTTCSVSAATSIGTAGGVQAYIIKAISPACFGQCNGAIKVKALGGTAPFAYHWAGSAVTIDSLNNICAGTYSVTITDANGCTSSATQLISQPQLLTVIMLDSANPVCPGQCNGHVTADGSGGSGPYISVWNNGESGLSDTALCAGTYTLNLVDQHGCTANGSITLTTPLSMSVAFTKVNDSCFNQCDGRLLAAVTNGTQPLAYHWNNGPTGPLDSNLCALTYTVSVTDSAGCTVTASSSISQPTLLSVSLTSINDSCFGQCNGSATATGAGGTPPYTYTWTGGATGNVNSNLCIGQVTVTVKDALGCTASNSVIITQPTQLTSAITGHINDSCFGQCDGSLTVTAAGGTTPYTYAWNNNPTTPTNKNLCIGTYTVTVKDHNACVTTVSDSISQPVLLSISLTSSTNEQCFGQCIGQATVSAAGGTLPYTFHWSNGATGTTASNLCAGIYHATVTDALGCSASLNDTITQPARLVADTLSTVQILCFGGNNGAITLGVSGGVYPYTYVWPQAPAITDSLAINLTANTYTANITDANGCTASVTTVIHQPAVLNATVLTDSVSCFNGSNGKVFIYPTGGVMPYHYQLDGAGPFQSADSFITLSAGAHSVITMDTNGCTFTNSFTIYQPTLLVASLGYASDVRCNGQCNGVIQVNVSGGTPPYSYSIDAITYFLIDSFTGLCPGGYNVNIFDYRGCPQLVSAVIGQPTPVVVVQTGATPPRCYNGNDGTFTVSGSGGTPAYTFSADGGAYQTNPLFTGMTPGNHGVVIKDANGCTDSATVVVPNAPLNDLYDTAVVNVTCNGGSDGAITTTLQNGNLTPYTYLWSYQGASTTGISNIPAGIYHVTVTDANGCRVFGPDPIPVTQPTPITDAYIVTKTKCFGSSDGCVSVTPSGGTPPYTHSWSNGDNTANPCNFPAGSYADTIRDANLCVHIENTIVVTQPSVVTDVISATPITCPGLINGTITVTPGGGTPGYTYNWAPISSTAAHLTNLNLGQYNVTVTDANNCTTTDSATITAIPPMMLSYVEKNTLCPPLKNGFIILTVTGGTPAYSYLWNDGNATAYDHNLGAGIYVVTVTDANGCKLDTSVIVGNDSVFSISVTPDTITILEGDEVQLATSATGGAISNILWSPDYRLSCTTCTTPTATPLHTIQYDIRAVSDSGCVYTVSSTITVIPQHQLYIPNVFTPNNDGLNDVWEIFGNKKAWLFVEVNIFDRWGERVFTSNDINFQWDGSFKGTKMEPNVYVYTLTVTFIDDYTTKNKGSITLLR